MIVDDLATIFTGSPLPDTASTSTTTVAETDVETPGETTPTTLDTNRSTAASPAPYLVSSHIIEAHESDSMSATGATSDLPSPRPTSSTLSSSASFPVHSQTSKSAPISLQHPLFSIEQLGVDNRLIVNRKRQLKMHRVWMQGRFVKLAMGRDQTEFNRNVTIT